MRRPFGSYFLWGRDVSRGEDQDAILSLEKRTPRSIADPQLQLKALQAGLEAPHGQDDKTPRNTTYLKQAYNQRRSQRTHDLDQLPECHWIEDNLRGTRQRLDDCSDRLDQMQSSAARIKTELEGLQVKLASLSKRERSPVYEDIKLRKAQQAKQLTLSTQRPVTPEIQSRPQDETKQVETPTQDMAPVQDETPPQQDSPAQDETSAQNDTVRKDTAASATPPSTTPEATPPRTPRVPRQNKVLQRFPLQQQTRSPETTPEKPPLRPRTNSGKIHDKIQFWSNMQQA